MGLFTAIHDTIVAKDILKANNEINSYQREILNITRKYGSGLQMGVSDKAILRQRLNDIESKARYMQQRLNDIAPENRFKTWVYTLVGQRTAAPGYIASMLEMVQVMRQDLNNY